MRPPVTTISSTILILITRLRKPIVLGSAALCVGIVAFVGLLWAFLDMARIQQSHGGEEFTRSARTLHWVVSGEVLAAAVATGFIMWRGRSPTARLLILAAVLWVLSLVDVALLAMAGAVPR